MESWNVEYLVATIIMITLAFIGCDQPLPPVAEPVPPTVWENAEPQQPAAPPPTVQHPPAIEIFQDGYEVSTPITELESDHTHAILAWNVESGDNDPATIAHQLKQFVGYDVFCLCEVHPDSLQVYANALETDFDAVASSSGRAGGETGTGEKQGQVQ